MHAVVIAIAMAIAMHDGVLFCKSYVAIRNYTELLIAIVTLYNCIATF